MAIYALDGIAPELPLDGDFWVAETAAVIGRVRLAKGASVWFGCTLRGDNEWIDIGENTNVQDGCVLHTDMGSPLILEDHVTVGHSVVLHGCHVQANSLIGMGSTLLNGVVIGRNCLVGAHSLVAENKVFERNSLIIGSPARVLRPIDDAMAQKMTRSALSYVANARRFKGRLERIG